MLDFRQKSWKGTSELTSAWGRRSRFIKRFSKQLGLKKMSSKKFLGNGCPGHVMECEVFCWGEGASLRALLLHVLGPPGPSGPSGKGHPSKKFAADVVQCGKEQIGDFSFNLSMFNHCKLGVFIHRLQQPQQDGRGHKGCDGTGNTMGAGGFSNPLFWVSLGSAAVCGGVQLGFYPGSPVGLSICVAAWHKPLCVVEPPALGMLVRAIAWPPDRYLLPFKGRILALMLRPSLLQLLCVR